MVSGESCRLAVYDADTDNFLGYQTNIFGGLSMDRFETHPKRDTGLDGFVMGEFLHVLSISTPPAERIRVEVERISEDGGVLEIAAKYLYERVDHTRRYVARELVDE